MARSNAKTKAAASAKKKRSPANRKTAFWLTITVLASLWMFVLGILVGRGTAPVQFDVKAMEQELADLKAALAAKETAKEAPTPTVDSQIAHFSFYDALKDSKEEKIPAIFDAPPENDAAAAVTEPAPRTDGSRAKVKSVAPKPAAAAAKGPAAPAKPSAPKASTAAKPKGGSSKPATTLLTIQVMSVKDAKTADAAVQKLKNKGFDAYRSVVKVRGSGIRYRVRVGRYQSRKAADDVLTRMDRNNIKGIIVSR